MNLNYLRDKGISKKLDLESIVVTLLAAFLMIRKALPEGKTSLIGGINLPLSSNAISIREAWGLGDAGSLLEASLTWANFQHLDPTTQYWIVRVWSPGFSIIEIPLIWLEKIGIPIFWSLLAITSLIWMVMVFLLWNKITPIIGRKFVGLILFLFFFSWDFEYVFRSGMFYTEGLSISTLVLGLSAITWSVIQSGFPKVKNAFIGGILVGISIWIRHVNDNGLLLILVISAIFYSASRGLIPVIRIKQNKSNVNNAKFLFMFAVIAFVVTIPWRTVAFFIYKGAPFLMSSASYLIGPGLWAKPGSGSALYWSGFGSNWACKIDIQTCLSIPDEINGVAGRGRLVFMAIRAALMNPLAYIQERLSAISINWIPGFKDFDHLYDLIGITYILIVILIAILLFQIASSKKFLVALIWLPFLIAQLAQLMIIHYESRYFITVRMLLLGFLMSLMLLRQLEKRTLFNQNGQVPPYVDKNAICESKNLGSGTRIWAFSHVSKNAIIGMNCNIGENVFIENLVVIGDRVTIKNGVQVWDGISIEDDVFVGPNATFTNDKFPRSKVFLETYLRTIVRQGASIGANATILPGLIIGEGAMVGAGAVVTKDVPSQTLVVGNPARIVGKISNPHQKNSSKLKGDNT